MKNVLVILQEYVLSASPAEEAVIRHILQEPERSAGMGIKELSKSAYTSPATIVRLCSKIGFGGYKEFRQSLAAEVEVINRTLSGDDSEISSRDSLNEIVDKVTHKNIQSLEMTRHLQDLDTLEKCVTLLDSSKSIGLFGVGAGLVVARDAYMKLLRINKPCVFNDDWHNQLLQAQNMTGDDLALVISYSGRTREVLDCVRVLRRNSCPIVAITQNDSSPLAQMSTYNIYIPSNEQVLRSGAMASRMAQLNIIDILYTAYAYRKYDYVEKKLAETYIQK